MTSFSENPHSDHLFFQPNWIIWWKSPCVIFAWFKPGLFARFWSFPTSSRWSWTMPWAIRKKPSSSCKTAAGPGLAWIGWDFLVFSMDFWWLNIWHIGISGFMEPIGRSFFGFFIVSIIMVTEARIWLLNYSIVLTMRMTIMIWLLFELHIGLYYILYIYNSIVL